MNNEVIFFRKSVIRVNEDVIQEMKNSAKENISGKIRYCFHESENANMQEMLFVVSNSGYSRPHMHKEVAESHVVVDGEGYCVLFDQFGNIMEAFRISTEDNFIYRIQKGIWHMVIPLSEQMVIYEIREGKFDSSTNIFPEWAPKEGDEGKIKQYKQNLINRIGGI